MAIARSNSASILHDIDLVLKKPHTAKKIKITYYSPSLKKNKVGPQADFFLKIVNF